MALLSYNTTTKAVGEFQNLNQWLVEFSFPQTTIPDDVKFRCVSTSIPEQTWENISTTINRFELTQPSHLKKNGEISFEFTESTKSDTMKLFEEIRELISSGDDKDHYGVSQGWLNIKGSIIITLLDSQGNPTQKYKLQDVLLQPETGGDLGSDADVMKLTLKVVYNWWVFL